MDLSLTRQPGLIAFLLFIIARPVPYFFVVYSTAYVYTLFFVRNINDGTALFVVKVTSPPDRFY